MTVRAPFPLDFRYLSDMRVPGLAHAAVLRSPHPHARIRSIDVDRARAMPGVLCVLTAGDVPGRLRFGLRIADQPILCDDTVRTAGDPVAAVAAETRAAAEAARDAIRVDWELLPVVATAEEALAPTAPAIHAGGNVVHETHYARGDLEAAFAASTHVVAHVYRTPHQVPAFIETESALAIPDGKDGVAVYAPGHWAEAERLELSAMLALDPDRVRVIASPAGGSFGGKDQLHSQPLAALLAMISGRPVRLRYSREDSFRYGIKRHPFIVRMRTGCGADGRLSAHEVDLVADTGAYAQHGPEVLDTAHENVQGPYSFAAVQATGRLVYTNTGICGAVRGFGALQVQIALEQQIDRLARACGKDPLAFRSQNLRPDDAPGQLGQALVAPVYAGWALARMRTPAPTVQGRRFVEASGIALVEKGEGFARGGPNHARVALRLDPAGKIEASLGLSELGQGLWEVTRVAVARLLGVGETDVVVTLGDTARTPDTGPIAASRGVGVVWRAFSAAAPSFRKALLASAAERTGRLADTLSLGPGGIYASGQPDQPILSLSALAQAAPCIEAETPAFETATGTGAVHAAFTACGAEARIRIDRLTGAIRVLSVRVIPVTGPVLSREGLRAQCEGGVALAIGFLATERLEAKEGFFSALNFDGYLPPTSADAAEVEVDAVENIPLDALGPRGVGEIGVNAVAPAIANAVFAATGRPVDILPLDRKALIEALEEKP